MSKPVMSKPVMSKSDASTEKQPTLNRIQEVRLTEDVTLGTIARKMGKTASQLKKEECPEADLRISDLVRWQSALNVPLIDLLVEPEYGVSDMIRTRGCLVRVTKTANSILRNSQTPEMQYLAQTLIDQLVEIMPELKDQGAWHDRGVPRPATEPGKIAEYIVDSDWLSADDSFQT